MTLHCLVCGEEAALTLNLQDGETISCPECSTDFTTADVQERITEWTAALAWINNMPQ
jgi:hypothetical protein